MIMKNPKDPTMSTVGHRFSSAIQFVLVTLIVLSSGIHQTATARPANEIRIQRHIAVTMRDGVKLYVDLGAHPMEFNGMDHMKP